jgi:phage shock protein PspC (stress-responsive transcriptional regulator)
MWASEEASSLDTMTTTDQYGPPSAPAPPRPPRTLRRSRTDRVGAGVAGGLGEYFGVDPVLFRVLFATAAFFGGAGLLLYLLAWTVIPESDTERSPVDNWIHGLRQRRLPFILVAIVAAVLFWLVAFSWWAPGPVLPIVLIIVGLVLQFGRRKPHPYTDATGSAMPPTSPISPASPASPVPPMPAATSAPSMEEATWSGASTAADTDALHTDALHTDPLHTDPLHTDPLHTAETISLEKATQAPEPPAAPISRQAPQWVHELREWAGESRAASRARRRRALPIKIAGLVTLVVALAILGLIDAVHGIAIPTYLWFGLAIIGAALLVGLVTRRTPWSLCTLLVPIVVGLIGFGGTHASLHDGIGQKDWQPTTSISQQYRLAFGQAVLDLRGLSPLSGPRTVDVTMASGQVKVIAPAGMNVTLRAEVHLGDLTVDGSNYDDVDGFHWRGVNLDETVPPLAGASGPSLLVRVRLADGNVSFDHT